MATVTALVRAEFRKAFSTKLWWALLIPVVVIAVLANLFGGALTSAIEATESGAGVPSLLPVSLAYSLSLTSIFAVIYGIVTAAGEFRHRIITTTYLTAQGRGRVFVAKSVSTAAIGALYAAAGVLVGVLAGLAVGSGMPGIGPLLALTGVGLVAGALWAVLGAALGTAMSNQVTVLVVTLVYLLAAELLLSLLLNRADSPVVTRLSSYLPGNSADVALYDLAAGSLLGPGETAVDSSSLVELLAGVTAPPPWWGALLVFAAWTAAAAAVAWVVGGRRDIT